MAHFALQFSSLEEEDAVFWCSGTFSYNMVTVVDHRRGVGLCCGCASRFGTRLTWGAKIYTLWVRSWRFNRSFDRFPTPDSFSLVELSTGESVDTDSGTISSPSLFNLDLQCARIAGFLVEFHHRLPYDHPLDRGLKSFKRGGDGDSEV